ncbi:MAG: carbamoyltransferase HypF [candidate division Zixibacteria bacterium RBG_16_50_21]|nr:MAG: carbamoyltransferase HypF [candidate division Zixibacteria bacterium RBG_16_50_21]
MVQHWRLLVKGTVQGVGFRPFVFRLAQSLGLKGKVCNNSSGVIIDLEGDSTNLARLMELLRAQKPTAANITDIERVILPLQSYPDFKIWKSSEKQELKLHVPADIAICPECEKEIFNPADRRYNYPFTNCTNCGPRYTIIQDLPYDRPFTSMSEFQMCPECQKEYNDPSDRRFHAQPNACPKCGPSLNFIPLDGMGLLLPPLDDAVNRLRQGEVIAVKGIGGFHLACDARNAKAVGLLRDRKKRTAKPFAIMVRDLGQAKEICEVSQIESQILQSMERPIVLLCKKENCPVAKEVAPGLRYLGVMLPYSPLHHILLEKSNLILVMTSANNSEEPILYRDQDAPEELGRWAEGILTHNRKVERFCDDSVVSVVTDKPVLWRRSRGFVPRPLIVKVNFDVPIFAAGGHFKNSFCLARGNDLFLSPHIGDLENLESYQAYIDVYRHYQKLSEIKPEIAAHDLHPEYLATRFVQTLEGVKKIGVQHHEAHIASCMAEHGLQEPVIGVAFDGTGLGWDGKIWGGEFFAGEPGRFERVAHFKYLPLPGGEAAILHPAQMGFSVLQHTFGEAMQELDLPLIRKLGKAKTTALIKMIQAGINSPLTSSLGRIFDAISVILNHRGQISYEGEAAIALEMLADGQGERPYGFGIRDGSPLQIDLASAVREMVGELTLGVSKGKIAARFHSTIIKIVTSVCQRLKAKESLTRVCLSGGCFMNRILLEGCYRDLTGAGFEVFFNSQIPINDGGLAVGQAVIANSRKELCA